jgi:hypothetical protein
MLTPGLSGTPGWFARWTKGEKLFGKNGAAAGFASEFHFAPGRGDAVIYILNCQGAVAGMMGELLREVCGLPIREEAGGDE